jgi:sugar (pentulose or hexulose) kinase
VTVLTLDLGTTATKAALWGEDGLVAIGRAEVETHHPEPGAAEQEPAAWWRSVVDACGAVAALAPGPYRAVTTIGFSAARESFAAFDDDLEPLGPGILWSDARGDVAPMGAVDPTAFRRATGVVLNPACCAAKVAWFSEAHGEVFGAARWLLAPRDWIAARLTGHPVTDRTLASRTGFYGLDGGLVADGTIARRLPPVVPSTETIEVRPAARDELGLPSLRDVVIGAGDRQCEVVGSGAGPATAMVSWGTTSNVSIPHPGPIEALPGIAAVSRGALGGFLVEAGLSASGAALEWLASLTGRAQDVLLAEAVAAGPGANGVVALPWLHGARGPWWQPDARAAFVGLTRAHGAGDMARAIVDAVALDVARCIDLVGPSVGALALAGGGAGSPLWREVVGAATGRPVIRRAIDDAASVGARLVVAAARGETVTVDDLSGVVDEVRPDPALVERYAALRAETDSVARAVLALGSGERSA